MAELPHQTDPRLHNVRRLLWIVLIAALLLAVWGVVSRVRARTALADATAAAAIPVVTTVQPTRSPGTDELVLPGNVQAFIEAPIYARTSGYLRSWRTDIGTAVAKGELLAEIEAPEVDQQYHQGLADLATAEANASLAESTDVRWKGLLAHHAVSQQDADTKAADAAAMRAAATSAGANVARLRELESFKRVVAPFDGVITQRAIDNGSLVTSGSTFMFTLQHPDVIRTQLFVPQDEAFGLGPGVDAVVRVPEIPDRTFPGKVTRIASALQPGSRTLLTEIDVPNPDGALSPGIYCIVDLYIPRKTPSMIVPADAVVFDQNGLHVAVVENGVARFQKITIARDFGTEVEVHDGVKSGDQVILNPMVDLADGSKVAVRSVQKVRTS